MAAIAIINGQQRYAVTLNQIRAFIMVAQHGGFTAAARVLGMSHTTLNSQIQMIERDGVWNCPR
jgi:molybdenum-dependent DNA-binding transcriptional regulator ModE